LGAKNKRVTISKFKGKLYVGIREYYEDGAKMKPGKKGISLQIEEWEALKECMKDIDEIIEKK
jgi:hypothetical protein